MIKFHKLIVNNIFILICVIKANAQFSDKIISSNSSIDSQCIDLIKGVRKNITRLESCDVYKCFEERFPCGNKYWIMNWGYKYCIRYGDQDYINKFTEKGSLILNTKNSKLNAKFKR